MERSTRRQVTRSRDGQWSQNDDALAVEGPMEIRLGTTPLAVVMRTPGDDADLVLGFSLTEGIVVGPDEVDRIEALPQDPDDNRWELVLAPGVTVDPEQFRRNTYTTSSCGVCGKASIDAVRVAARHPPPGPTLTPSLLLTLPGVMRRAQATFAATGGLHAAALFTADGALLALREDIGRHNAVDKVIGAVAAGRWPLGELTLMVSGRVSFEITQKAAVAGLPVVCGVSAASSLAVDLADELGLTVIGFLRDDGFNLYAGEDRVTKWG